MHESRLVTDLVNRAEIAAADGPGAITRLTLRIGALSPVGKAALHDAISRLTTERWGFQPEIDIEIGADPSESSALGVVLVSLATGP